MGSGNFDDVVFFTLAVFNIGSQVEHSAVKSNILQPLLGTPVDLVGPVGKQSPERQRQVGLPRR